MTRPMARTEILSGLEEIARQKLERAGELSEETRLVEDLRLDSLGLLTLAIEVENRFRIRLDEQGVVGVETAGELADAIAEALGSDEVAGDRGAAGR